MRLILLTLGDFIHRYALAVLVCLYALALVFLHAVHLFPRPGLYDISHLIGASHLTVEGEIVNFPSTRWGRTRFLMNARAEPLSAFHGLLVVGLAFPAWDLAPGDRVRVKGWIYAPKSPAHSGAFDEKSYWYSRQTYALLRAWSPEALDLIRPATRISLGYWAWRYHQAFETFWLRSLLPNEAALLTGITLGTRGLLPKRIKDECIRAGVYHILVVSGQKVALLVTLGVGFLTVVGIPRRHTFWVSTPLILFYALAVGADPPVVRASAMAIVLLGVSALARDIPRYYPLFLAGAWILLRQPAELFGASFQLSFGATASLIAIVPLLQMRWSGKQSLLKWFTGAGAICLAAHLGTWPLLLTYFHQLSLAGLLANWTLFPFSGFVLIYGLVVGTWGALFPNHVPFFLVDGMHHQVRLVLWSIEEISHWSWSAVHLPAPGIPAMVLYYAGLFGILFLIRRRKKHAQNRPPHSTRRHRL